MRCDLLLTSVMASGIVPYADPLAGPALVAIRQIMAAEDAYAVSGRNAGIFTPLNG